ncbi:MAG: Gfo/Idh/MocA family oxidoreductase [Planctomycetia bacterium]|nr:Gfo/Idh/MocA family oxidoreductase [Planctomycetia bacterium]
MTLNLTTEQKAIGKENFLAAIGNRDVRRNFLKQSSNANLASGKGMGRFYFKYGQIDGPVRIAILGTGDEGSVLIGGLNPEYVKVVAIADIRPYNQYRAFHGDCYSASAAAVRPGLMKKYGWKTREQAAQHVKVYNDYRELLKDARELGIEGVIIGLPLHLHAPAAIEAMKQGCHVLTEKLMGHSIANCKDMIRAAAEYKKHLTVGHQRHYNILYDHATDLINKKVLGDLHYIRAQWHRGNLPGNDSWQMPLPEGSKEEDVKLGELTREWNDWTAESDRMKATLAKNEATIDHIASLPDDQKTSKQINLAKSLSKENAILKNDLNALTKKIDQKAHQRLDYLLIKGGKAPNGIEYKSAADYGYVSEIREDGDQTYDRPAIEELIRWRLWNRTGGGLMAELGSHQLDAASIFIAAAHGGKKQYPLSVSATGSRSLFNSLDRDVDDHVSALYEYPAPDYDPNDELGKQRRITVAYSTINGNGFGGYGETVFGTKGTLMIETEKEAFLYRTSAINDKTRVAFSKGANAFDIVIDEEGDPLSAAIGYQGIYATDVSRGYCEEIEHWAYCIRKNPNAEEDKVDTEISPLNVGGLDEKNRPKLLTRCRGSIALWDAVIALATNISADLRTTVPFDPAWFDYKSDSTPEFAYAEQLVEHQDGENDEDYQKRLETFKNNNKPNFVVS